MSSPNPMFVEKILSAIQTTDSPSAHRILYDMIIEHISDYTIPTAQEIVIGITKGKIECIKEFKSRTGFSLTDSKHMVENYFKQNKIPFYGHYEIII